MNPEIIRKTGFAIRVGGSEVPDTNAIGPTERIDADHQFSLDLDCNISK